MIYTQVIHAQGEPRAYITNFPRVTYLNHILQPPAKFQAQAVIAMVCNYISRIILREEHGVPWHRTQEQYDRN